MRILLAGNIGSCHLSHIGDDRVVVEFVEKVDEVISLLRYDTYDAILLTMGTMAAFGYDLIRRVRLSRNDTPLLAVTRASSGDWVKILNLGVDDVVVEPVDPAELRARLISLIRRSRGLAQPRLQIGSLDVCLTTREVRFRDRPIKLTAKEYEILQLMVLRKGSIVPKDAFLSHLYGGMDQPEIKIIDVFICKLRRKLSHAGVDDMIKTVWGQGYVLYDPTAKASEALGHVAVVEQEVGIDLVVAQHRLTADHSAYPMINMAGCGVASGHSAGHDDCCTGAMPSWDAWWA